jgi:hypothetical protein
MHFYVQCLCAVLSSSFLAVKKKLPQAATKQHVSMNGLMQLAPRPKLVPSAAKKTARLLVTLLWLFPQLTQLALPPVLPQVRSALYAARSQRLRPLLRSFSTPQVNGKS